MPGCLHNPEVLCPTCRQVSVAACLLGLSIGAPACGASALYGAPFVDSDLDGYEAGEDCDDEDPDVHPGAEDPPGDGIDQDCDGADSAADSGQ